ISETFYGGRVRNGPRVQDFGAVAPPPLDRTLIFVDTAGVAGRGERVGRGGSIANTLEAGIVAKAVAWLDEHVTDDLSLCVISGDSRTITASPDPEVARRFKALLVHVYRHGIIVPAGSFLQPPRLTRRPQGQAALSPHAGASGRAGRPARPAPARPQASRKE